MSIVTRMKKELTEMLQDADVKSVLKELTPKPEQMIEALTKQGLNPDLDISAKKIVNEMKLALNYNYGLQSFLKRNGIKKIVRKRIWRPICIPMLLIGHKKFMDMNTQIGNRIFLGHNYYKATDVSKERMLWHEYSHFILSNLYHKKDAISKIIHAGSYSLDVVIMGLLELIGDKKILGSKLKIEEDDLRKLLEIFKYTRIAIECFCYCSETLFIHYHWANKNKEGNENLIKIAVDKCVNSIDEDYYVQDVEKRHIEETAKNMMSRMLYFHDKR